MRARVLTWSIVGLLIVAAIGLFWPKANRSLPALENASAPAVAPGVSAARVATTNQTTVALANAPGFLTGKKSSLVAPPATNHLAYRLANTSKKLSELARDNRAVILENALIDTSTKLGLKIPGHLRAAGDPGSYIVQARKGADAAFRAALTEAGATLVSYLPNDAWLVRASAEVAQEMAARSQVHTVLAWEPYYKLKDELLGLAVQEKPLAEGAKLNLLVFADARAEVAAQLAQLNLPVLNESPSPFGTIVTIEPTAQWSGLARLPGVQLMELAYQRVAANDLTRERMGIAPTSVSVTNHLGLTGSNVLVSLNDFFVDATHPDLAGRLFAGPLGGLVDFDGHGTHVAGILAGSGVMSTNMLNARGSINPAVSNQFRGMAPAVKLFFQPVGEGLGSTPDQTLQEGAARTNALISNNSWIYIGASTYSLAAASFDAATRDSLSGVPGSQPMLYVFAAGNDGDGSDEGLGGDPGSIRAPATAKNVIAVGALELPRDITNEVEKVTSGNTNLSTPWKNMTSSANHVAGYSSRGNVGIGIEGEFGRFKPDVVAPGSFVISTRTLDWDEIEYYNPTNYNYTSIENQVVSPNTFGQYIIFIPENAVGFEINLVPNENSPVPFPNLPIFVRRDGAPSTTENDLVRTNDVSVPPDLGGLGASVGQNWFYGIRNPGSNAVNFDIFTTVITTNDLGNYYTVLSNLNNSISSTNATPGVPPNYYRYESGTSMSAPAVSGALALMQEFFEQRLAVTNSPALMKALLINGARSAGNLYDFQVRSSINYQGWGLVRLDNTLQAGISNVFNFSQSNSVFAVDQSPTNALATGQSRTWTVSVDEDGQTLPLRVSLVWTDPPGNPGAGMKLVNDLDLIITNNVTGDIYFGNDFSSGSRFTFSWDTNEPPNIDAVNNVENIYIAGPLDTNYSITVSARRVNVNAVTAHTNDVVQDFALVISSGAGEAPGALQFVGTPVFSTNAAVADVVFLTNSLVAADYSSAYLVNQRVGANTPLLGTTNGLLPQWKFYVITNTTTFTNASFLISQQANLAVPRQGVFSVNSLEATRRFADVDLYVSTDPLLLELNPAALTASVKSRTRNDLSGDEYVIFDNSVNGQIYYIAVKSEDQQAAQYEFWGIFSLFPLGAEENGFVRAYPMAGYEIPDGSPSNPGGTRFVAIPRASLSGVAESVRRVIVTNNISHENFGDLINTMDHNTRVVVLDNHRVLDVPPFPDPPGPYRLLYDDSGEGDFPTALVPNGPGTFETFIGEPPGGTWYFTYSDDALTQTGRVNDVRLRIDRQLEDDLESTNNVGALSWIYFSRNVPVEATNLTICVDIISPTPGPLQLYVRKGRRPTPNAYDYSLVVNPPGDCLTIDQSLLPPLSAGRYFIGIFNPNPSQQTFVYSARLGLGTPPTPLPFDSIGSTPLLDDAATNYSIVITNELPIGQIDVGLRIDHPRVSDLAVTLVSPRGTRVLLVENRGGTDTNGFGTTLTVTNIVPVVVTNGGPLAVTNTLDTGTTFGSLTIDYNFFTLTDRMTVYYEGNQLLDTGFTNGVGRLTVNYGPGTSTEIDIVMNEGGNPATNTLYSYVVSSINTIHSYLTFTENTNKTITPVKFALPPFNVGLGATSIWHSSFENQYLTYSAGQFLPEGWRVDSGTVDVIGLPNYSPAAEGTFLLDLNGNGPGQISTNIVTVPGQQYILSYAYERNPASHILSGIIPTAQLLIDSNVVATVVADNPTNTNLALVWKTNSHLFTATFTNTLIVVRSTSLTASGVFFDAFDVSEIPKRDRYVLPEESLKVLEGESAAGVWRLEILDTRVGASNNVSLVNWQLSLVFQTNTALPRILTPGVPVVTTLPPGQIVYYIVDVPTFVRYATNTLFNANTPVGFYFNQIRPPSLGATNVVGGDIVFAANALNHTEVLSAGSIIPPTSTLATLLPGQRYFLAVENTSAVNATFTVYVDFDLRTFPAVVDLTNGVPYCAVNPVPLGLDYYRFTVSSNAVRAQFDLRNLTGDMTLLLRRELPPTLAFFDYLSANNFTNDEVITVFDFSAPVPLSPGDWYFAAANLTAGAVTYCATAREWAAYGTNIVVTNTFLGTNSFCLTWTSLEGIPYVVEGVTNLFSTNWVAVSPTVFGTGATTTYCVPLPSPYQFFRVREGQELDPFVPPPAITRIVQRFNGIEITWSGPPGQQYQVEWSPTLIPAVWTPFTEIVTSLTGVYQYLDNGSQTAGFGPVRYYRLVLLP